MTSNIGTKEANVMGFNKDNSVKTENALKDFFTPEFRNRLSATIKFSALSLDALETIVDRELDKLNLQMAAQKIKIKASSRAKTYLANEGYDERYGARHIARVIDEKIKEPLTDEILFGTLRKGGIVKVGFSKGALTFAFKGK